MGKHNSSQEMINRKSVNYTDLYWAIMAFDLVLNASADTFFPTRPGSIRSLVHMGMEALCQLCSIEN